MITVPEAARRLGITRQAVHGLIKRGTLAGVRVGFREWGVDEVSVRDRLRKLAEEGSAAERRKSPRRATASERRKVADRRQTHK